VRQIRAALASRVGPELLTAASVNRWCEVVFPKQRLTAVGLHGVTSQKIVPICASH
jgi:hypothetical protein